MKSGFIRKYGRGISPWILFGAPLILLPIFALMTVSRINLHKNMGTRLLAGKGAALIRSLEAGTRTGMMGMPQGGFQLQRLFMETARETDIVYLFVADPAGRILAHNEPSNIGSIHPRAVNIDPPDHPRWRVMKDARGRSVFEVYKKFVPSRPPPRPIMGGDHHERGGDRHRMGRSFHRRFPEDLAGRLTREEDDLMIFVGQSMDDIAAARKTEMRRTLFMALTLLMAGIAGMIFLFLTQKYREKEIRDLKKQVVQNRRLAAVGRLAAGVAHEIRNPLSSIKGFATYFKERYRDKPEDRQIADTMIREVERLNRVVTQLLDFSRPVSLTRGPADMNRLIDNFVRVIERQASEKKITILHDKAGSLPRISVDEDRINQALLNLYLNAAQAMPEGGTFTLKARHSRKKQTVILDVSDTGSGIDPDVLDRIFEPYYTTRPSGSGLGLAMVHNIMEAHDGKVRVESREGEGTRFSLFFPYPDEKGKADDDD